MIFHNEELRALLSDQLDIRRLHHIQALLVKQNTFEFPVLETGLFSASALTGEGAEYTGYASAWVRDNIHIAHAHYVTGQTSIAIQTIAALVSYFTQYRARFENTIRAGQAPASVMERPHIRFDGHTLAELPQKWSHAQNDALGYFVWFVCKLVLTEAVPLTPDLCQLLALFPLYFQAIRYWEDEDNGHWEEAPKVEASSIGTVVAGLSLLKQVLQQSTLERPLFVFEAQPVTSGLLQHLIDQGRVALTTILPAECIQPEHPRRYDGALLFLIYPLAVVDETMTDPILEDVIENLQGDYGIKRYLGDSFWSADYKDKLSEETRTIDFSADMSSRNALLKEGEEAQWCIFDPVISVIFGLRYQATGQLAYLDQQIYYFKRSIGQLTAEDSPFGAFKCPEAYYLAKGQYVPNDVTPLLWTQANLILAFHHLENSLKDRYRN